MEWILTNSITFKSKIKIIAQYIAVFPHIFVHFYNIFSNCVNESQLKTVSACNNAIRYSKVQNYNWNSEVKGDFLRNYYQRMEPWLDKS